MKDPLGGRTYSQDSPGGRRWTWVNTKSGPFQSWNCHSLDAESYGRELSACCVCTHVRGGCGQVHEGVGLGIGKGSCNLGFLRKTPPLPNPWSLHIPSADGEQPEDKGLEDSLTFRQGLPETGFENCVSRGMVGLAPTAAMMTRSFHNRVSMSGAA